MTAHPWLVEVDANGVEISVTVNGCAVVESWDGSLRVVDHLLEAWVVEGENLLEARVGARLAAPEDEAFARVALHRLDPPVTEAHETTRRVGFALTSAEAASRGSSMETIGTHAVFSLAGEVAEGSLDRGSPYGEGDRAAVEALVTRLHVAFQRRDVEAIGVLLARRTTEVARGLGLDPAAVEDDQRAWLEGLFSADDYTLAPFDVRDIRPPRSLGGRLLHLREPDHRPLLRGRALGVPFGVTLTLGNRQVRWEVLR